VIINQLAENRKAVRSGLHAQTLAVYNTQQLERARQDLKNEGLMIEGKRYIAAGSYGQVWMARDLDEPNVPKVVKIIIMDETSHRDYVANGYPAELLSEIAAQRLIHHPNVLGIERVIDMPFTKTIGILMERMKESLENYIERQDYEVEEMISKTKPKKLAKVEIIQERQRLALGMMRGMAAIHRAGLLHMDFKPGNVLLDNNDNPRIADFGLVLSNLGQMLRYPWLLVTWPYRAPEQLCGGKKYTYKNDLWSLGIVLIELFFGLSAVPHEDGGEETAPSVIAQLCGWPLSFVKWMDPAKPDYHENFIGPTTSSCFSEIPTSPQRSGDEMARKLLANQYDNWIEFYGRDFFNHLWVLLGNMLQVDPRVRNANGGDFLIQNLGETKGEEVKEEKEMDEKSIEREIKRLKTEADNAVSPEGFMGPEFDILPSHTLSDANNIEKEYKREVGSDVIKWNDRIIRYAAADIASKINADFALKSDNRSDSFVQYLFRNGEVSEQERMQVLDCEDEMEEAIDWDLFSVARG